MAIVNATLPIGDQNIAVPISVTPVGEGPQGFAPTITQPTGGSFDFTGLTGLVTAVGGILGAIGFKMFKDSKRDDIRANILAETQLKQVQSLQETDKADALFKAAIAEYISDPTNEENKTRLKELAKQSEQEYKSYYENITPQPLDYHKDEVVRKLSAVQKRSVPDT